MPNEKDQTENTILKLVKNVTRVSLDQWDVDLECGHTIRVTEDIEPVLWMMHCHSCTQKQQS